jgi:endonuclease-3
MADVPKIIELLKKEYPGAKYYLNYTTPFELYIAVVLSAQCKDEIVNEATNVLFKLYKTPKDYINSPNLAQNIRFVTFAQNKAGMIKKGCETIMTKFNNKIPDNMDDLLTISGVGRKSANVILQNAFNKVEGIVVDTHVIRLSTRIGLSTNNNPDKMEKELIAIIPKDDWATLPHLLKSHGRKVCMARPKCRACVLKELCPSAFKISTEQTAPKADNPHKAETQKAK